MEGIILFRCVNKCLRHLGRVDKGLRRYISFIVGCVAV
jgi:hypothetical protein